MWWAKLLTNDADLVQQRRHAEQQPVPRTEPVVRLKLVEQPQGHFGDVLGVGGVGAVLFEHGHRRVDHAFDQGPVFLAADLRGRGP